MNRTTGWRNPPIQRMAPGTVRNGWLVRNAIRVEVWSARKRGSSKQTRDKNRASRTGPWVTLCQLKGTAKPEATLVRMRPYLMKVGIINANRGKQPRKKYKNGSPPRRQVRQERKGILAG